MMILVLGKARSCRVPNQGCRGSWVTWMIWCFTINSAWDVMHEQAHCCDEAANRQLPIAMTFWIIQIFSTEEYSSLMQNLMQIHCSTCSVILNVTATQYTCSLSGHLPLPLTSTVKSLFTHVHSRSLSLAARSHLCHTSCSCYINNGWTFSRTDFIYVHVLWCAYPFPSWWAYGIMVRL